MSRIKKPFSIIICPSSDAENEFQETVNAASTDIGEWRAACKMHRSGEMDTDRFDFATEEERDAFIEGYEAGVGYLGDGAYCTNPIN